MKKNTKITWGIIIIVIIIAIIWIARAHNASAPSGSVGTPIQGEVGKFSSATDTKQGISFVFATKLPTTYISTISWPPQVTVIPVAFACKVDTTGDNQEGKTEKRTIGGHDYCITTTSEGAAGSVFTHYVYSTAKAGKVVALPFTLQFVQCSNYEGSKKADCAKEQKTYDIDGVVDDMVNSIKFI